MLSSVKIETEPNVVVHSPEPLFEIDSAITSLGVERLRGNELRRSSLAGRLERRKCL